MANLTIMVDEDTLRRARIRALEQGTSVNALLRDYLEDYAGLAAERREAARAILELSERAASEHRGERWRRAELYER